MSLSTWEPHVPNANRITIRMLLDMHSGIWDEGGSGPDGQTSKLGLWIAQNCKARNPTPQCGRYWAPQRLIDLAIQQGKAAYPPGQVYYYSDTNYMILALIAQKVTREPLGVLMKQPSVRSVASAPDELPQYGAGNVVSAAASDPRS